METTSKPGSPQKPAKESTCQICGKTGGVVFVPEKSPPNRLCYRCAAEYGARDEDEER